MELDVAKVGLTGVVKSWEVVNPDGSIAQACYEPKNNLILDTGLDFVGTTESIPACFAYLAVGTGTGESTTDMTTLQTETTYGGTTRPAASGYTAYNSTTIPAADADPFIVIYQIGIQTDVGKLNGTFTELGFGPTSTKGANLWSRFRVVDAEGEPTSFTITSEQQLRLKYQLSIRFLPIVPTAYECAITGYDDTFGYTAGWQGISNSAGKFALTYLVLFGTSSTSLFTNSGWGPELGGLTAAPSFLPLTTLVVNPGYSGYADTATVTRDAYVPGSYSNYINALFTTLQLVGNVYGLQLCPGINVLANTLIWLCVFDTPIAKPNTHNLAFKLKFSWGRG